MNNKDNFRELLLDLKYYYNIKSDVFLKHYFNKVEDYIFIFFNDVILDEIKEDIDFLYKKLIHINK